MAAVDPAGAAFAVPTAAFENFMQQLANQLVQQATKEHARALQYLFEENIRFREEVQRVAQLLDGYLVREQQLHEQIDTLATNFSQAGAWARLSPEELDCRSQLLAATEAQRRKLETPMMNTKAELERVRRILADTAEFKLPDVQVSALPRAPSFVQPLVQPPRAQQLSPRRDLSPRPQQLSPTTRVVDGGTTSPSNVSVLPIVTPMGTNSSPVDSVFALLDRNGDGVISRSEWAQGMAGSAAASPPPATPQSFVCQGPTISHYSLPGTPRTPCPPPYLHAPVTVTEPLAVQPAHPPTVQVVPLQPMPVLSPGHWKV